MADHCLFGKGGEGSLVDYSVVCIIAYVSGSLRMERLPSKQKKSLSGESSSRREKQSCGQRSENVIWVGNLAHYVKEKDLTQYFGAYYTVTSARVIRDTHGKSKCCAFVNFSTTDEATNACSRFHGTQLKGRKVKVEMKKLPPQSQQLGLPKNAHGNSAQLAFECEIWVGSLPRKATERDVSEYLSKRFGSSITAVRMVHKSTGNYAFVAFDTAANAQYARLNMDGAVFLGASLKVRMAKPGTGTRVGRSDSAPAPLDPASREKETVTYRDSDPLVTRLLCRKTLKQVIEIAKPLCVCATTNKECNSLILSGAAEAVARVHSRIVTMASEVRKSLTETVVTVDSFRVPALSLERVQTKMSQLEEEMTVVIGRPGKADQHGVVKETELVRMPNRGKLQLCKKEIITEVVDAIVCPIGNDFQFQEGLPHVLLQAAGKLTQDEVREYNDLYGPIQDYSAVDFCSGDLNCKRIIFVAMPTTEPFQGTLYSHYYRNRFQKAYKNVLSVADRLQLESLSFPAILYRHKVIPNQQAARLMVTTIQEYAQATKQSKLDNVRIVTLDDRDLCDFQKAFDGVGQETKGDRCSEASASSTVADERQWKFQDDSGAYLPFDPSSNQYIEKKFLDFVPQATVLIGKFNYLIDFSAMTQRNLRTGKTRNLQRSVKLQQSKGTTGNANAFQWVYYGDDRKYHSYDVSSNSQLENAWNRRKSRLVLFVSGQLYLIDFVLKTQTNWTTKKRREIKRTPGVIRTSSLEKPLEAAKRDESRAEDLTLVEQSIKVTIRGLGVDVKDAVTKFTSVVEGSLSSKSFSIPSAVYDAFERDIASKGRQCKVLVTRQLQTDSTTKVQLEGVSHLVDEAMLSIQVG